MLHLISINSQYFDSLDEFIRVVVKTGKTMYGISGLGNFNSARDWFEKYEWASCKAIPLLLFEDETQTVVGMCCLYPGLTTDLIQSRRYNLEYCIRPDLWNHGYGTRLLEMVYAFARTIGMSTVRLAADNPASIRAIEKSGATLLIIENNGDHIFRKVLRAQELSKPFFKDLSKGVNPESSLEQMIL